VAQLEVSHLQLHPALAFTAPAHLALQSGRQRLGERIQRADTLARRILGLS
jgi:hypothetical protein